MTQLGMMLAHRHLNAFDRLIGIIGEASSRRAC